MREKILINHGWRLLENPPEQPISKTKSGMYNSAKTERLKWGPGTIQHLDNAESWGPGELCTEPWKNVDLPNDYIIAQQPDPAETCALGFFKSFPAWYRKHFTVPASDEGRRIAIFFEGITGIADIYLNGCFLKHNDNGYVSFECDITDLVRYDEDNVIAVYVNPDSFETWWYAGGGIYRNVWLIKTDYVAVDLWGVFVPVRKLSDSQWAVPVEVAIKNIDFQDADVAIDCRIEAPDGSIVGSIPLAGSAAARDITTFKGETTLDNPQLWDIDSPTQYTMLVTVSKNVDGKFTECDSFSQKFGFRHIEWRGDTGFYLNGRHVILKGVCTHLDFGLTGKAVPDNICRYKAQLIKEMGANAFRTSHYPHQEAFMDACDELGLLVMDENRRFESNDTTFAAMEMLLKRDRNRPSVILWSTGNEEKYHNLKQGIRIHRALQHLAHKLDPTRLVTSAMTNAWDSKLCDDMDVIGVNYSFQGVDKIHEQHPDKPLVGSENCATGSSRAWYFGDCPERGLIDARDKYSPPGSWFAGREQTWKFITARPWYAGTFQWDAIEHRGEALWPRLCSVSGAIDLFLQKKDAFYQNQSHWLESPMIHVLPHWNLCGLEGTSINVWVYTNCEEAELFLNGESLGRKAVEKWTHLEWNVDFVPGKLEVIGYNGGQIAARDAQETTGKPVKLHLELVNGPVRANGEDIALFNCTALDEQGREVPDASPIVSFACSGCGRIVGTGASNTDHVPMPSTTRQMYAGKIAVAVKMGTLPKDATSAKLTLVAQNESLAMAAITCDFNA